MDDNEYIPLDAPLEEIIKFRLDPDNYHYTNRAEDCPKGGKHSWIGDDAGDSWCQKCGEALYD